jgi:hypothetical protein
MEAYMRPSKVCVRSSNPSRSIDPEQATLNMTENTQTGRRYGARLTGIRRIGGANAYIGSGAWSLQEGRVESEAWSRGVDGLSDLKQ